MTWFLHMPAMASVVIVVYIPVSLISALVVSVAFLPRFLFCSALVCLLFGLQRRKGASEGVDIYLSIYLSIEDTEQHIATRRGVGISWSGLPGGTGGGGILDDL